MERDQFYFFLFRTAVIGTVLSFLLSSCGTVNKQQVIVETIPESRMTSTQTVFPTQIINPTPTDNDEGDMPLVSSSATQWPVNITTNEPMDVNYIYKYAIVTLKMPQEEGEYFLNLDNLSDNSSSNSDLYLYHADAKEGSTYELIPVNGTSYYYSDLFNMNYDRCLEHFPFTQMEKSFYSSQSSSIVTGREYCVLTNVGHLAIIRMDPKSMYLTSDDGQTIEPELVVTTYKKIVPEAFASSPTDTPEPGSTPDKYAGMNLTVKQKAGLDKAAQKFLDAITTGDRKTVASMMEYPLSIDRGKEEFNRDANDEDEFLSVYSELFTPKLVKEFAAASVDTNMRIFLDSEFVLDVPDCWIFFHPDGTIYEISKSADS